MLAHVACPHLPNITAAHSGLRSYGTREMQRRRQVNMASFPYPTANLHLGLHFHRSQASRSRLALRTSTSGWIGWRGMVDLAFGEAISCAAGRGIGIKEPPPLLGSSASCGRHDCFFPAVSNQCKFMLLSAEVEVVRFAGRKDRQLEALKQLEKWRLTAFCRRKTGCSSVTWPQTQSLKRPGFLIFLRERESKRNMVARESKVCAD